MSRTASRLHRSALVAALLPVLVFVLAGCSGASADGADRRAAGIQPTSTGPESPSPTAPAAPGASFTNPLLPSGPDPYVIRANGLYYYTQTSGDRIELWATPAMSALARASRITIFVPPPAGANSRDVWAPELHRLDGRWYVYYSAGDGSRTPAEPYPSQRIFVLENESEDPMQGSWIDRGRLVSPDADAWAIDGTVLDLDGQRYFLWSGRDVADEGDQHLYVAMMTNPWTLAAGRVRLSSPDRDWERTGRIGVNEAPQVLRNRRGDVFLLYSANGCWTDDYALGMLSLRAGGDPLDVDAWVKSERPVFATHPAHRAYGPGHNTFFRSPDGTQDWLLYHANASAGQGCGDARTPRMQPIAWRADGTPELGTPVAIGVPMPVPAGELP